MGHWGEGEKMKPSRMSVGLYGLVVAALIALTIQCVHDACSGEDDSAPMEVILWQFTVREEHPVAVVALRKMLLLLEEQHNVVIRGIYFAVPADVYKKWTRRQQEKNDESIDITSQAARSAIQQAQQSQPGAKRSRGRPAKKYLEASVLCDAVDALGRIKQFVVEIPATGVSKHWPRQLSSA